MQITERKTEANETQIVATGGDVQRTVAVAISRAMSRASIKGQIMRAQSGRKGQRMAQVVTVDAMIDPRAQGDTAHMALNAARRRMYRTGGGAKSMKRRSCSAMRSMVDVLERREARQ